MPATATEVVVVTESSHWDPNWLFTADRYYRWCVRPALDRALDELAAEPRRVFGLECLFFVDRYWSDRPERRDQFRSLVDEGRLRFTGSGVTTPDTLLPDDELILRDLLIGQEWLRTRGMEQEPRLLYLPDSFGHSPGLPALLRAAGVDYAAVSRIDGMRFPGADLEPAGNFPRPGSSAAHLIDSGTADFVWRSADGSEVLTHWLSKGYGHGDLIASGGLSRAMGLPAAWPDRRPRHVDQRVAGYLEDLRPLARTPYRLLALGLDFVRPVHRLLDVLDAWNERNHDRTGTWLVNAGLDDYMHLVDAHRADLPTIDFDPNPYWTGFYASRPSIKRRARDLGRRLVARDAARSAAEMTTGARLPDDDDARWWTAAASNHHDFVTGTAPDRVAFGEQMPWLNRAIEAASCSPADRSGGVSPAVPDPAAPLEVRRDGERVIVECAWGSATFDPERGGSLVRLTDTAGNEQLSGPSLELASHSESGGLWRMGHELYGGSWALRDLSSRHPAKVVVSVDGTAAHITTHVRVDGFTASLHHIVQADSAAIVTRTSMHPPTRRTVTLVVRGRTSAASLAMHQPGGMVNRPLRRWYDPTFWPLHSFASVHGDRDAAQPADVVVSTASPTALHVAANGVSELVVARTAVKELAFGVVPVLAPAWGLRWMRQRAVVAHSWPAISGSEGPAVSAVDEGRRLARLVDREGGRPDPGFPVVVDDPGVDVIAVKPAHRGDGTIVRLRNWSMVPRTTWLRLHPDHDAAGLVAAHLTDSRERDLEELAVTADGVEVPLASHLTTIRLATKPR